MYRNAGLIILLLITSILFCSYACAKERVIEKIEITSNAFKEGEMIPKRFTGFGENISPDLKWSKPPIGTKYMAIICEDPDAPARTWIHWIVYNIPFKSGGIAEKMPHKQALEDGTIQGENDFKKIGYDGPHPPYGVHRYYFRVYALDSRLKIDGTADKSDLIKAMEHNILAEGCLMGRYSK